MKYEFKEGDFVESVNGNIGWVRAVCYDATGIYDICYNTLSSSYNYKVRCLECVLPNYFKRIGTYDFTKPEQPKKIEYLPYEKTVEARGGKDNVVLKRLYLKLDQEDIIDKLNEVIDRVNEIGEKNE